MIRILVAGTSAAATLRSVVIVIVVGLVEQEVRGELLVLVAREVGLDGLVMVEAKAAKLGNGCQRGRTRVCYSSTHPLNGVPLLLSDTNSLSARRQGSVIIDIFTEQTQELARIVSDHLGELRVAGAKLLKNRLEHLRLLLDDLAELLELSIVTQEVQVAKATTTLGSSGGSQAGSGAGASSGGSTSTTGTAATPLLSSKIEQVDVIVVATITASGLGRGRSRSRSLGSSLGLDLLLALLLFLLDAVGNSLQERSDGPDGVQKKLRSYVEKILDSSVRVVEGGAHGSIDLGAFEAHGLHVGNHLLALGAHRHGWISRRGVGGSAGPCGGCGSGGRGGLSRGLGSSRRGRGRSGRLRGSRGDGGGGGRSRSRLRLGLPTDVSRAAQAWHVGSEAIVELTLLTMHTTNPFSSILYDSTVSSSFRILPGSSSAMVHWWPARPAPYPSR